MLGMNRGFHEKAEPSTRYQRVSRKEWEQTCTRQLQLHFEQLQQNVVVCATAERRARGAEEAGFHSTSDLKGDRGRRQTQEAKGGGENEDSYFCTLRGATGNSLQHALGAELFNTIWGRSCTVSTPLSLSPKQKTSLKHHSLSCASALLCSSSTAALCSHSPLSFFLPRPEFL